MISAIDKERILSASRIEEVVGDFVQLKKRGANLLGLCPFHNERTPSFTVSPSKGFFKCFGCGKAGDAVTFIMEHEHFSFPESLKYLANKYGVVIEESEPTPEELAEQGIRDSLYAAASFASKFYAEQLWDSDEGQAIGLSYFRERGFTDEIIRRFELGYSPDRWDALTKAATTAGYKNEILEKAGLTIINEEKIYDRFRARVIFPIHNLTGRTIAFGARILRSDPKSPKYLNSPETDIYIKGKTLYGISQARKSISSQDLCYLVEGYTDVLSMHQAGVENVVASSGTALTVEQIRLIARYTKNITVLYDGDTAGIKASLRGIDLILEEGMNVRVVLFPDGEDPDSFSRKNNIDVFKDFLASNAADFITFKTKLLLNESKDDPMARAGLAHEIVDTIAKIPDAITRSSYIRHTSRVLDMTEQVLYNELNKILRKKLNGKQENIANNEQQYIEPTAGAEPQHVVSEEDETDTSIQEAELMRILISYAGERITLSNYIPEEEAAGIDAESLNVTVKDFILNELQTDGIKLQNEMYAGLLAVLSTVMQNGEAYDQAGFIKLLERDAVTAVSSLTGNRYELSDWSQRGVPVRHEKENLTKAVLDPLIYLKKKQLLQIRKNIQKKIKEYEEEGKPTDELLQKLIKLDELQKRFNLFTNTVIHR